MLVLDSQPEYPKYWQSWITEYEQTYGRPWRVRISPQQVAAFQAKKRITDATSR